jgi:hypothetical protein
VITRPAYLYQWLRTGAIPDLTVPNLPVGGAEAPTFFGAYGQWMQTTPATWEDVAWLRAQWDGPFMLKGVTRIDDAKRAVDAGATAVSVSNHGGNDLDGTPATIRALPAVAAAVGGQVEVLLDGGIRRGGDVVKAVALGAKAVMIGRAYLWGLAANGQAGVENVLDILRGGIDCSVSANPATFMDTALAEERKRVKGRREREISFRLGQRPRVLSCPDRLAGMPCTIEGEGPGPVRMAPKRQELSAIDPGRSI